MSLVYGLSTMNVQNKEAEVNELKESMDQLLDLSLFHSQHIFEYAAIFESRKQHQKSSSTSERYNTHTLSPYYMGFFYIYIK